MSEFTEDPVVRLLMRPPRPPRLAYVADGLNELVHLAKDDTLAANVVNLIEHDGGPNIENLLASLIIAVKAHRSVEKIAREAINLINHPIVVGVN
jgi:hypothetical protein